MEQCYACVEAFADTPVASSGLPPEPAPESALEPVPEPVARARRPCAAQALRKINGIIEWETCAEDSELFQAQARAMDEQFKKEEEVLESEEEEHIEDSDNESEYESEDDSEYESSFIDDADAESSEGEYVPPRKKLRTAESSDEGSAGSPASAERVDPDVNAAWIANCKLWVEYSPDDSSMRSCMHFVKDIINKNTMECMIDPRKKTHFIKQLYRYRNQVKTHVEDEDAPVKVIENEVQELSDAKGKGDIALVRALSGEAYTLSPPKVMALCMWYGPPSPQTPIFPDSY